MRRLLVLILALCLLASASAAPAAKLRDAPGTVPETGFTLEAEALDVSQAGVYCALSAAVQMTEAGFTVRGASEDGKLLYLGTAEQLGFGADAFFVTDISPLGNVMFGMLGDYRACLTDGKLILQTYSAARSTPDAFGVMDRYTSSTTFQAVTRRNIEGVVWSPDGMKAAITDVNRVVVKMDYESTPLIIVDVQAGEYYTATTSGKIFRDPFYAAPSAACFDESGRYVYCVLYPLGLIEHDTVENTNRLVAVSMDFASQSDCTFGYCNPFLNRLADGRLVYPTSILHGPQYGLGVYTQVEDEYGFYIINDPDESRPAPIPGFEAAFELAASQGIELVPAKTSLFPEYVNISALTGKYDFEFIAQESQIRISQMDFSAESGLGIAYSDYIYGLDRQAPSGFKLMDSNNGFSGLNDLIVLTKEGVLTRLTCDEFMGMDNSQLMNYVDITNAVLSPDGYHALLCTRDEIYLCELETLSLTPVACPEDMDVIEIGLEFAAGSRSYVRGITWQANDIILTPDGMFRLKRTETNAPAQ